jgi:hypothetical protein
MMAQIEVYDPKVGPMPEDHMDMAGMDDGAHTMAGAVQEDSPAKMSNGASAHAFQH